MTRKTEIMRHLLSAALLAVLSSSAIGADWVFATQGTDSTRHFIDGESVVRGKGGVAKAWILAEYQSPQEIDGKRYYSTKNLYLFDCANRTVALKQSTSYSQTGEVVSSVGLDERELKFSDVVPESIGETWFQLACGKVAIEKSEVPETDESWRRIALDLPGCFVQGRQATDTELTVFAIESALTCITQPPDTRFIDGWWSGGLVDCAERSVMSLGWFGVRYRQNIGEDVFPFPDRTEEMKTAIVRAFCPADSSGHGEATPPE